MSDIDNTIGLLCTFAHAKCKFRKEGKMFVDVTVPLLYLFGYN